MNKVRLKQKRLFKAFKITAVITAVLIFIYIGIQPIVADFNPQLAVILNYICDFSVIAVLILLFLYYSKYGKCEEFITSAENEINDAGYYFSSREEKDSSKLADEIFDDLKNCGFSVNKNIEINDFDFSIKAENKSRYFYLTEVSKLDKNDVIAYLDAVINDLTVSGLKRKGSAVLCFITDNAEEDAVSLSKMITPLGRKGGLKLALAIYEISTSRVYFLGNVQTKCQQMIANFVMNCQIPVKEQFISKEKLPFQYEIEEKMKSFSLKEYKNGNFYIH